MFGVARHAEAEKELDHSEALQQPNEVTGLHTRARGRKACHGVTGPAPVCSRHIRSQMHVLTQQYDPDLVTGCTQPMC